MKMLEKQKRMYYPTNASMDVIDYGHDGNRILENSDNFTVTADRDGFDNGEKEEIQVDFDRICDMEADGIRAYIDANEEL